MNVQNRVQVKNSENLSSKQAIVAQGQSEITQLRALLHAKRAVRFATESTDSVLSDPACINSVIIFDEKCDCLHCSRIFISKNRRFLFLFSMFEKLLKYLAEESCFSAQTA